MDVKDIIKWLLSQKIPDLKSGENALKITIGVLIFANVTVTCSASDFNQTTTSVVLSDSGSVGVGVDDVIRAKKTLDDYDVGGDDEVRARIGTMMNTASEYLVERLRNVDAGSMGRTFGRPIRRLQQALLPIMFKLGVISTLIFLTFLMAVKGVGIGLLLLMFKIAALFAKLKTSLVLDHHGHHHDHHDHGWTPPHKEVHVHVHGHGQHVHGHGGYDIGALLSHHDGWNRHDASTQDLANNYIAKYGSVPQGPPSINTPYGHYVRVDVPAATNTLQI